MKARKTSGLVGINKVLEYTGLSRSTVYKKINEEGFPPGYKLGSGKNGARRWSLTEVEEWVQQHRAAGAIR